MSRLNQAREATRHQLKARVALDGPSGGGKTWTSLEWATVLAAGEPVLLIDTERGSGSLYSDRFKFDTIDWAPPYNPLELADTVRDAGRDGGWSVVVIDSFSHFWEGEGGALDEVDAASSRAKGNNFAGWKVVTPQFRRLIDVILGSPLHVITTMRTKTEWVLTPQANGKTKPERIGMAPVMRAGIEYEFTLVGDLDLEHRLTITKSRCAPLADQVVQPGRAADAAEQFMGWLTEGEAMPTPAEVQALKDRLNAADGATRSAFRNLWGHPDRLTAAQYVEALASLASPPDEGEVGDGPQRPVTDPQGDGGGADDPPSPSLDGQMVDNTRKRLFALLNEAGIKARDKRLEWAAGVLDRDVLSFESLSEGEAQQMIGVLADA